MENKYEILKKLINSIRDLRAYTIKSDDLSEEQLYYLQEGYREGLCSAAMMIADELDATIQSDVERTEEISEYLFMDLEEQWWHHHTDEENGDKGTPDRY